MYMYVRYNSRCLPLNITMNPSTYSSDFPDILLKWNIEDPVSDFEKQRNSVVAQTQGNRNPFIDNAYLATVIWGGPAAQNTWPDTFSGGTTSDSEAPSAPGNLTVTGVTSTSVALSWTASTDNVAVSGYDVYVDNVFQTSVTSTSAAISGLAPSTTYMVYVVARDAEGNKSNSSATVQAQTLGTDNPDGTSTTCGTEDFENIPATNSSYSERTWVNKGITWTATNARTDKQIHIDGDNNRAICLRKGTLTSSTISGGIGSLTVKTYLPFSDAEGSYTLKVNGEVKGQIPYSKTAKNYTINDINVDGNVVIELVDNATSNRVSFDNLSWTCYTKMAVSEQMSKNNRLTVYPNPVKNGELFISGIRNNEAVQIYNANGQLVQTVNATANEKINVRKLSKGVYFLKTKTGSSKIIVD